MAKKTKGSRNKKGKKLFTTALDGFYYFTNDSIEDLLDKALIKFQGFPDWRKKTRAYLWSFDKIRGLICDEAEKMFNTRSDGKEDKDENQDIGNNNIND